MLGEYKEQETKGSAEGSEGHSPRNHNRDTRVNEHLLQGLADFCVRLVGGLPNGQREPWVWSLARLKLIMVLQAWTLSPWEVEVGGLGVEVGG